MEIKTAVECLGALAHEARLRVFRLLVRAGPEGLPAGELAARLDCPPQTLSFHLKHLGAAGLVTHRRLGRSIIYSLRKEQARQLLAFLGEDCCQSRRDLCAPIGASPRARRKRQGDGTGRTSVLFVCSRNSARSQMAEAFLRREAGERFEVRSAGLRPDPIHPLTIRVMQEVGIDLTAHRAQDLGAVLGGHLHELAIVVCDQAQQDCREIYPFALKRLYWPFEDPAAFVGSEEECIAKFREVRDAIEERIRQWLAQEGARQALA